MNIWSRHQKPPMTNSGPPLEINQKLQTSLGVLKPKPTFLWWRMSFLFMPPFLFRKTVACFWNAFSVYGKIKTHVSGHTACVTSRGVLKPRPTSLWYLNGFLLRFTPIPFLRFRKTVGCFWKERSVCKF